MATTQNTYTGNGSTTDYSITFEYLKDADVKVTLDHVATTAFTLPNATTLRFNTAPGNNVAIRIFRDTDVDAARFVYSAGSAIKAAELNENADQALYGLQETTNTDDITDEAVTTAKLRDGAVTTAKLGSISITTAKLADSSVTTAKIADDAVTTAKILDDNVTAAKLATDSVTADAIAAGAVATSELATDAVTTVKIVDDAVTTAKIASGAVTSDSIANGTIQTEDIADVNITTAKIANDAVTAAKLADNAVVTDNIVDANVTTAKIADSAVTTAKIADAELVELATMGGNTASALADLTQSEVQILDGATVTTAELNILDGVTATAAELNQLDGNTLKTTGTDFTSASQFPAASEIDARITARIDPLGGFEAIADEDSFPATAPPEGTVISIANANNLAVNSSGVGAGTRAGGSDAVVINGFPSTFNSTSLDDGIGLLVIATSTAHTYNFHRVVAKNEDVRQLSSDINDFKARYRIGSSNPTTDNDAGDLFFNTGTSKMLVYNATSSAWEEVQAVGDFFINTISSSSGTGGGSATFNGTAYRFTLSNAPTYAQQLLVSINGVVQKPNSGTSQPSEGFAIDGGDIILAAAPATGSNAFFITIGSSVGIGTPSDNTISTAKIIDSAVTSAKIADDTIVNADVNASAAIAGTKISPDFGSQNVVTTGSAGIGTTSPGSFNSDGRNLVVGTGSGGQGMSIYSGNSSYGTIYFADGTSGDALYQGGVLYNHASNFMRLDTAGAERLRINSSGNVGIGTSSPADSLNFTRALDLNGASGAAFYARNNGSSTNFGAFAYYGTDTYIENKASGNIFFKIDGSEKMRIDSSGRVGIGTSSPSTKFVVSNSGAEGLEFGHTSGTSEINSYNRSTSARIPVDIVGQTFKVLTGNPSLSTGLFQDSSGNVGIGCDDPQYQIDLSASSVDHLFTGAINAEQDGGDYALKLTALGKSGGRTGSVRFITGTSSPGSEIARFTTSGLTFNGDTAAANALDDYEEGAWTPACAQFAAITSIGKYTKIGRIVYIEGVITRNTATAPSASNINITGLPFTVNNIAATISGNYWLDEGGPSTNQGDSVGSTYFNGTTVLLVRPTDPSHTTNARYLQADEVTNTRGISFYGWYSV